MDVRILSFLLAILLLAITRYNREEVAAPAIEVKEETSVAASEKKAPEVFEYQKENLQAKVIAPNPSPSPQATPSPTPVPLLLVSDLKAREAALFDLRTGELLFTKGTEGPAAIASISKLMSAVIAKEIFEPNATFVMAAEDFAEVLHHPDLQPGDTFTFNEALHLLLIQSDNAVSRAIARTYGMELFVQKMNAKARQIHMAQTVFVDPAGLGNNVASSRDLLRLAQYITKFEPNLFEITKIPLMTLITKNGKRLNLKNTNQLIGAIPNFIGGKTGFTEEAGGCLMIVLESREREMVSVVLGSEDRFGDTEKLIEYSKRF